MFGDSLGILVPALDRLQLRTFTAIFVCAARVLHRPRPRVCSKLVRIRWHEIFRSLIPPYMPRLATMVLQSPVRGDIRVLVVDHDPQVLRVITRQLERLGISQVQTAADGDEAMRLVTSAAPPYDVVLCDFCMPNEGGLAFLRRLADRSDKPAVILTSGEGAPVLEARRGLGADRNLEILGVAAKPHSLTTLAQLLARLSSPRSAASPASATTFSR